jgi:hypothetical protein|tara:strand:- start:749 stop:904 length:156 start_codon:yes stop_codon:yes gene_type:complete
MDLQRQVKDTGEQIILRKKSAFFFATGFSNSSGKKLEPSVIRDVLGQKIPS